MKTQWSNEVFKSLRESLKNGRFCDIILKGVGFKFRAHKIILASACSYFDDLFDEENVDIGSPKSIVYLPEATLGEVALMLRFAYSGDAAVSRGENGPMFEKASVRFGFRQCNSGSTLIEYCKAFYKMHVS